MNEIIVFNSNKSYYFNHQIVELPMTAAATAAFSTAIDRYGAHAAELHVARRVEDNAQLSFRLDGKWPQPWEH